MLVGARIDRRLMSDRQAREAGPTVTPPVTAAPAKEAAPRTAKSVGTPMIPATSSPQGTLNHPGSDGGSVQRRWSPAHRRRPAAPTTPAHTASRSHARRQQISHQPVRERLPLAVVDFGRVHGCFLLHVRVICTASSVSESWSQNDRTVAMTPLPYRWTISSQVVGIWSEHKTCWSSRPNAQCNSS